MKPYPKLSLGSRGLDVLPLGRLRAEVRGVQDGRLAQPQPRLQVLPGGRAGHGQERARVPQAEGHTGILS